MLTPVGFIGIVAFIFAFYLLGRMHGKKSGLGLEAPISTVVPEVWYTCLGTFGENGYRLLLQDEVGTIRLLLDNPDDPIRAAPGFRYRHVATGFTVYPYRWEKQPLQVA